MSSAENLANQLKLRNPNFKKVWDDPERKKKFELRCQLIEYRLRNDFTYKEVAAKAGIFISDVHRIEDGELDIDIEKLERIINKLK